jgi:membrane protease YdiL (CAAX protease family)
MFTTLNTSLYSEAILMIPLVTACFLIHYFISGSEVVAGWFRSRFRAGSPEIRLVVFHRLLAVFLFGVVPVTVTIFLPGVMLEDYGIGVSISLKDVLYALPFAAVFPPLSYFFSRRSDNLNHHPQFRVKEWDYGLFLLSVTLWIAYLLAYEFMFRGVLLYSCIRSFDIPAALVINISLYTLVHLPRGITETIGAIPFGLILCLVVIRLESVWAAIFIHSILAVSNEWFSLRAHPDMVFIPRKELSR